MTTAFAPFDAAAYLDSDEVIAEYLSAAAEDPNLDVFSPRSATSRRRGASRKSYGTRGLGARASSRR